MLVHKYLGRGMQHPHSLHPPTHTHIRICNVMEDSVFCVSG